MPIVYILGDLVNVSIVADQENGFQMKLRFTLSFFDSEILFWPAGKKQNLVPAHCRLLESAMQDACLVTAWRKDVQLSPAVCCTKRSI